MLNIIVQIFTFLLFMVIFVGCYGPYIGPIFCLIILIGIVLFNRRENKK